MKRLVLIALLLPLMVLTGCNNDEIRRQATSEMNRAEGMLLHTKHMGLQYAPDQYKLAEAKFEQGKSQYEKRNYRGAQKSLVEFEGLIRNTRKEALNKMIIERKQKEAAMKMRESELRQQKEVEMKKAKMAAEKAKAKTPAPKKTVAQKTYKVQVGDTLRSISKKFYGTPNDWKTIYEKNKDTLNSPEQIKVNQVLKI